MAKYLNTVPNRISLSGHTDDKAYVGARGYTNWELSADRANAARRALLDGGLEAPKIARVVGLASSVLFDRQNPNNPINRRISIIVMTKSAEATALSTDAPSVEDAREAIESGAAANAPAATESPDAVAAAAAAAQAPRRPLPAAVQGVPASNLCARPRGRPPPWLPPPTPRFLQPRHPQPANIGAMLTASVPLHSSSSRPISA